MWLLLSAFRNQWVRARSSDYLLQLRISSNVLINNKGTKGSAMTLPQVRGMAALPKEQSGRLWLMVLLSAPASHMLWQGKYPWLALPLLVVSSTRGEEEEQRLKQRSQVFSWTELNGHSSHTEVALLPSLWRMTKESCLKGNMSWPLVFRWDSAQWVKWGHKMQGIHRSHTVGI